MSGAGFLLIIVAFGFLYFVMIRPQKKRQLQSRQLLDSIKVGDEVVTAAGIYGRVAEIQDTDVLVDIAPQVRVKVARRAIGAVIPPAEEIEEPEDGGPE
jgi:preprotein translocase subunit YajC